MKGKNMKRCFNDTKIALSSMIIMLCLVLPGCDLFKKNEEEKKIEASHICYIIFDQIFITPKKTNKQIKTQLTN